MSDNDSISEESIETDSTEMYIEVTILLILCIGAILGNSCMWFIICRSRDLRTVTNAFILGLTTADLLVSLLNMPVTIATIVNGSWPLSDTLCVFFGYVNMLTLVSSVLSLCNISINRYVMVCRPIYYKRIYTRRKAALMMTLCVSLSACLSFPPLVGWAEYGFISVQSFCFCKWEQSLSYAFFMIGCCFGGPFTVMSICNFKIFRTVRASKRRVQAANELTTTQISTVVSDGYSVSSDKPTIGKRASVIQRMSNIQREELSHIEEVTIEVSSQSIPKDKSSQTKNGKSKQLETMKQKSSKKLQCGKTRAEEVRLAVALGIVVLVFVICWFPYCISMMLSIFAPNVIPRGFHMTTLLVGYANSGINPIIYGVMNKKFGDGFKRIFCCLCQKIRRESTST
ncbi:hypothetical protein FSP39_023728 [Pinctada imbricata]|uniref:G-protein coupled receptors family 1 profile domain-containing protein n=1 Tax=Pinctada imbricata TaxID=66713 RepID=A0AA88YG38_PINIB|nr:hypothetical protein FSP39_023728 [Pinctada imbricata]